MLEKTGRLSFSRRNGLPPRSLPTSQNFCGRGRGGCFLKSQRHNQRNAPAIKPQKRKMGEKSCIFYALKLKQPHPMTEPKKWLCLSLWLIQDSNWKGRVLWKLFGGLATILQNWISCNEQKMREAHITRRGTNFYLLIFIEKNHQP